MKFLMCFLKILLKRPIKLSEDTELQQVINEQLLNNIFHLLVSDEVYPQVKASGFKKLKELVDLFAK